MKSVHIGILSVSLALGVSGGLTAFAKDLVWNGGPGAAWDDAAVVWLDGSVPSCWQPGATAVIPEGSWVRVVGEHSLAGLRFSGSGATVGGGGYLHVTDGVEAGAAGTVNAVSARLVADADGIAKSGAGQVLLSDVVGTLRIVAGDAVAGGSRLENCTITPDGGTLQVAAPVVYDAASNLLMDGSFEAGSQGNYWTGDGPYWKIASTNRVNGGWYVCRGGNGGWTSKPPPDPDGDKVVWLQGDGSIKQQVTVPQNGIYDLSCWSHLRNDYYQSMAIMYVIVDGVQIGYIQTSRNSTDWIVGSTGPTYLSAGTHEVMLMGERGWADTTIFLDKVMLGAPVLSSSQGLTKSTASVPKSTTSDKITYQRGDVDYLSYYVRLDPTETYTEQKQLCLEKGTTAWSGLVLDIAGSLTLGQTYARTDWRQWFYKRGAGALTLPNGVNASAVMLQCGTLVATQNGSAETSVFSLHDAPAKLVFNPQIATITTQSYYLRLQGSGRVELELRGTGRTFYSTGTTSLSAEFVAFNPVEADSTIGINGLTRLTTHNAGWFTHGLKKGAGKLLLYGEQSSSGQIIGDFTVRQGTLEVQKAGTFNSGNRLILGDALTPANAALEVNFTADSTVGQPLSVSEYGASRKVTSSGSELAFGPVALGGDLALSCVTGIASVGAVSLAAGKSQATFDASDVAHLYLGGPVASGVTLVRKANGGVSAGRDCVAQVSIDSLTLAGSCEFSFDSDSNDRFDVGALTLGDLEVTLRNDMSAGVYSRIGTFTLATYDSLTGDVSGLSVAAASRVAGYTYTFAAEDGALTLSIAVEPGNPVYTWNTGSASWAEASSWDHLAAPNAPGLTARFSDTSASASTVTLADGETNTVGYLIFAAQNGFALSGGTVKLATEAVSPSIEVAYGRHTITSDLLNGGTLPINVSVAAGASLTIDCDVYGDIAFLTTGITVGPNAKFHGRVTMAPKQVVERMELADTALLTATPGRGWTDDGIATLMVKTGGWYQVRVERSSTNWFFTVDGRSICGQPTTSNGIKNNSTGIYSWYGGAYLAPGPHLLACTPGLMIYRQHPGTLSISTFSDSELRAESRVGRLVGSGAAKAPSDGVLAVSASNTLVDAKFTGSIGAEQNGIFVKDGTGDLIASAYTGGMLGVRAGSVSLTDGRVPELDGVRLAGGNLNLLQPKVTLNGLDGTGEVRTGGYAYAEPITDAACEIDGTKTYTHAANFVASKYGETVAPVVTINGVAFTRYWNHANVASLENVPTGAYYDTAQPANNAPQSGDAGLTALTRTFGISGGRDMIFRLDGLTPGKAYDFRFYFRSFGGSPNRKHTFSFIDGSVTNAVISWNPDWKYADPCVPGAFSVVGCRYVAGASGSLTVAAYHLANDYNRLHVYGFTNELLADSTGTAPVPVTVVPAKDVTHRFEGKWFGARGMNIAGLGVQSFGPDSVLPDAFAVSQGTAVLSPRAKAPGVVAVAAGATLSLQGSSGAGGVSGEGTLHLAVGDADTRGAVKDDGSFAASTNYPRQVFFTNDDNCGVSSHKEYAIAAALGRSNSDMCAYVNGVPFTQQMYNGSKGCAYYPWTGVSFTGAGSWPYSDYQHMVTISKTESCWQLIDAGNYCNRDADNVITFKGLTPGVDYEARFYERSRDGGGNDQRYVYFTYNVGGDDGQRRILTALDRHDRAVFYVACRFTAASNMFQIVARNIEKSGEPFIYGISVEKVAPNERILSVSNDCTFAGLVTGVGELRKSGPARQTFTGPLAAASGWTVDEGELLVENEAAKVQSVCVEGGAFGGSCTVEKDLGVMAGGSLVVGAKGLCVNGRCVIASGAGLSYAEKNGRVGTLSATGDLALPNGMSISFTGDRAARKLTLVTTTGKLTADPSTWTFTGSALDRDAFTIRKTDNALYALRNGSVVIIR